MKSSTQKDYNSKFRNISVEFNHWRVLGWVVFTLLAIILYFLELSNFYVLGTNIPSILWIFGVLQLIRFLIQYIYEIPHRNSDERSLSNKQDKGESQYIQKTKCFGCAKELNPTKFQNIQNDLIEPLAFRSLNIKGHFCKKCANSYYYAELIFDLIIVFILFSVFLSIFLFIRPNNLIEIITLIVIMIFCALIFSAFNIYDRIKILEKYK